VARTAGPYKWVKSTHSRSATAMAGSPHKSGHTRQWNLPVPTTTSEALSCHATPPLALAKGLPAVPHMRPMLDGCTP
jgi:hypothetical protein